ncbi:hypothetical protein ACLIIZ_11275 [Azonexus caeni]|jgi:hypothetical protein|uniref:hypothetical protein n=1 Tax=Azonexus caeni TaxID=266126 RepID=UPI003A83DD53
MTRHEDVPPLWRHADGRPLACVEKIRVLDENYRELAQVLRDALEDGILLGCAESELRAALHELVERVRPGF